MSLECQGLVVRKYRKVVKVYRKESVHSKRAGAVKCAGKLFADEVYDYDCCSLRFTGVEVKCMECGKVLKSYSVYDLIDFVEAELDI